MQIGIVPRFDSQEALDLTEKIVNQFPAEEFVLDSTSGEKLGENGFPIENMDVDSLITIGGDGTVLYTLQKSEGTPILGINMGGRGFLADVKPSEATQAVKKLSKNELKLIERKRLNVKISGEHLADALNEGVVRSEEPSRVLSFRILIDGEEIERTKGDGLIVATPTGSTAYAMAAGGPIVDPAVEAFVAVPLSTHRPKTMPLVYPMSSTFEVELLESDRKADVTVDGQVTGKADQGKIIQFKKSKNSAKFFEWKGKFYKKIREKL
ncbi:hypothetical protein AKJ65_00370 [candidate division MSBL1 archaeon SCGC-AAA259E19]|uniref:NAD kinase n=2 Tax=candidate division MSBL1 TaxID=215777 RepID=A0A133V583_9EURY|nr:hypothetical protein AKJ65_00370 [candidate division MSBL1 archaeon SCGC-AAA259E19]KXB01609.1 hypothetical protein AKJ41_01015 [candidate division MSBL1 archaeon SCGC-AAA259O05]